MNCLVLTDTFPNRLKPWRGPYNRRQIECLARHCGLSVVNPLPWTRLLSSPRIVSLLGRNDAVLDGIPMRHPVFWYLPKMLRGNTWRGVLAAARRGVSELEETRFDIILATFAYPHGKAAMHLAEEMGVPYAVKVRGTDLHSMPDDDRQREATAEALSSASAVIAVSRNLAKRAADLGARRERVHVLHNGIDAKQFDLMPRAEARRKLGTAEAGRIILFVGALRRVKGLDVLLEACGMLADGRTGRGLRLAVAGDGPLRQAIERGLRRLPKPAEGTALGYVGREEVALWMNAADALVLPSRDEGCPNVVLEALACGTPVVASAVGAVPDLLDNDCGLTVAPERPAELANAVAVALDRDWDREKIRQKVAGMSWEENGRRLWSVLRDVVEDRTAASVSEPARSLRP